MKAVFNHFFISLIYFCISFNSSLADEVPVILWNIKGNSQHVKPVSAFEKDHTFYNSLKSILNEDSKVLVFSVSSLSLEDFSANEKSTSSNSTLKNLQVFLDSQKHAILPSVKNPVSRIHDVSCRVAEIVDNKIDETVLQAVSLAFEKACIVILHIPDAGLLGLKDAKIQDIQKVFLPSFERISNNLVGLFTGLKSSWGKLSEEKHYRGRNLLQAEESSGNLVNITGCILMYTEGATLIVKGENISLPMPPDTEGSECGNTTSILKLTFKTSGNFSSVSVKFNFTQYQGAWTTLVNLQASGSSELDENLVSKEVSAGGKYSFSCGDLRLRNLSNTVILKFERFQVQPFNVGAKFSESFDCVTWFTIPIWMGIIASFFFILIVNIGVYALFSVHTMDRFDDPKGKTITVSATAE